MPDPEMIELEEEFQEKLGTRVHIDRKEAGGQIKIDFFSVEDLRTILEQINKAVTEKTPTELLEKHIANIGNEEEKLDKEEAPIDDSTIDEKEENEAKLYDLSNFSL
jgi:thiamine pyrophosphate-dependent acetolactate synthase large subunit-like protein